MTYGDIVRKWQSHPINGIEDIDIKLHNFRMLFAFHSGKIENEQINYHDTREIFENGRVGRTLMNYYLIINNHPPIVIFEEDRKEYYGALEAFDKEEKLEPLVSFLTGQCVKTWSKGK